MRWDFVKFTLCVSLALGLNVLAYTVKDQEQTLELLKRAKDSHEELEFRKSCLKNLVHKLRSHALKMESSTGKRVVELDEEGSQHLLKILNNYELEPLALKVLGFVKLRPLQEKEYLRFLFREIKILLQQAVPTKEGFVFKDEKIYRFLNYLEIIAESPESLKNDEFVYLAEFWHKHKNAYIGTAQRQLVFEQLGKIFQKDVYFREKFLEELFLHIDPDTISDLTEISLKLLRTYPCGTSRHKVITKLSVYYGASTHPEDFRIRALTYLAIRDQDPLLRDAYGAEIIDKLKKVLVSKTPYFRNNRLDYLEIIEELDDERWKLRKEIFFLLDEEYSPYSHSSDINLAEHRRLVSHVSYYADAGDHKAFAKLREFISNPTLLDLDYNYGAQDFYLETVEAYLRARKKFSNLSEDFSATLVYLRGLSESTRDEGLQFRMTQLMDELENLSPNTWEKPVSCASYVLQILR